MGKGLAEFRKASDDFKRTWEREVALESARAEDSALLETGQPVPYEGLQNFTQPVVETPDSDLVVARENPTLTNSEPPPEPVPIIESQPQAAQAEPVPIRKQEWI
jgi:hypothetical protein